MAEHDLERRALPGRSDLIEVLESEAVASGWVSTRELEPATEWRDRRKPAPGPTGVAGRLRALLGGREER